MLLPAASVTVISALMLLPPTSLSAVVLVLKPSWPLPRSMTSVVSLLPSPRVRITVSSTLASPLTVPLRVTLALSSASALLTVLSPPTTIGSRSMPSSGGVMSTLPSSVAVPVLPAGSVTVAVTV
ncbi:hypothetical protein DA89_3522 [Vibrio paracholerae]|nr:hypothetical protein DA89_3522 [Vibrio paracholerae]